MSLLGGDNTDIGSMSAGERVQMGCYTALL